MAKRNHFKQTKLGNFMHPILKYVIQDRSRFKITPIDLDLDAKCLYVDHCQNPLDGSNEHFFNKSWGGTTTSDGLICSKCNNRFSSGLVSFDTSFDDHMLMIKNARGIITDGKKNPPSITLTGNAKVAPYVKLTKQDKSKELAPPEDIIESTCVIPSAQYRSAAHTCLKAIGLYFPICARHPIFRRIKSFIYTAESEYHDFAVDVIENDFFVRNRREYEVKGINHTLVYFSRRLNKVIGVVRLQGLIKRAIILSSEWEGPEATLIVTEGKAGNALANYWEFMDSSSLTEFMTITDTPIDEEYFKKELFKLHQWRFALGPMYELNDHLNSLRDQKKVITGEQLKHLRFACKKYMLDVIPRFSDEPIEEIAIFTALDAYGIDKLIDEYNGKIIDSVFNKRLNDIYRQVKNHFLPKVPEI